MKKRIISLLLSMALICICADALAVSGRLNQKMATRSGPGTKYTEEGAYPADTAIEILEIVQTGGTDWCQVEFRYNSKLYRAYTGKKRIDTTKTIPEGNVDPTDDVTLATGEVRYGPGESYAVRKKNVKANTAVQVFKVEGEWALCDYKDGSWIRGYIPVSNLANTQAAPVTPAPTAKVRTRPTNIIEEGLCIDYYGEPYEYGNKSDDFVWLVGELPVMSYFDGVPCVQHTDVYSGPGYNYWRRMLKSGKYPYTGTLDTNLRIYGKENGWIMIRYPSDANGGYRYGWTLPTAVSPSTVDRAAEVEFAWIPALTTGKTFSTEDPDRSLEFAGEGITAGCEVTALAFLDEKREWIYCEYDLDTGYSIELARGFLPADVIRPE